MKKTKVKFSIRKYNGDDMYSWAIFRSDNKKPIITGLSRDEANHYRDLFRKEIELNGKENNITVG